MPVFHLWRSARRLARRSRSLERLRSRLKHLVAGLFRLDLPEPDTIADDEPLIGGRLGLDSLDALEIILCIESCFKIKIPDENIAVLRSINTVVDFVIEQQDRKGVAA